MSNLDKKKMVIYFLIAIFFIAWDRFFKYLALNYFYDSPVNLIGQILNFQLNKNYYIAFSLPVSGVYLNIFISMILAVLAFVFAYLLKKENYIFAILVFLLICGAASNFYDRIRYGFVVDYFDLRYFTIFNLADNMIVFSIILIAWKLTKLDKTNKI